MTNLIEIHFDGGCKPTNPGNKYGSFEVLLVLPHDTIQVGKVSKIDFGWGTNNEAEFDSLLAALGWTVHGLWRGGFEVGKYELFLFTDSTVVLNRVRDQNIAGNAGPAKRMADLTKQVLAQLELFKMWNIQWRKRDDNVERFGH